ncbi:ABC transporter substrate-binding protein [Natrialbaceae archaeon A-CW2]|uniref:ABC transporter substrate-binding protein n=1 Tax=Natronosalvus amylolyticus TaxID=2961994 RepID=UPI0020C9B3F5|nr:ABC transporter substrate-binding protein [Natronosalvus amylolyticus]
MSNDSGRVTDRLPVSRRRVLKQTGVVTSVAGLTSVAGCLGDDDGEGLDDVDSVEIEFWHGLGGDLGQMVSDLAEDFSDQSDVITVDAIEQGTYRETMNQTINAVRAGNPPGLSQIFEVGTKQALDSDAFVPVEDIIPEDQIDFDNFVDPVLDYYRVDGTLNSMPFNSSNALMMYNKTAFEEAGLDPESPPETFQDVIDYSEELMDAGYNYGITWPNHSWFVEQWFALQDQEFVNESNGRNGNPTETYIDSDAGMTVFEWWQELDEMGAYLSTGIEAWGEAQQGFFTQEAPMVLYSTSSINPMLQGAEDNDFEAAAARIPSPGGDRAGVTIGGGSVWIPDGQEQAEQEAAAEFLVWLTEPEQQERWHRGTGYFPVREESIENLESEGFYDENPDFRVALDQLQEGQDTPATRGALMGPFLDARTTVAESAVSVLDGQPVEEVLQGAADDIEESLEDYIERQN